MAHDFTEVVIVVVVVALVLLLLFTRYVSLICIRDVTERSLGDKVLLV